LGEPPEPSDRSSSPFIASETPPLATPQLPDLGSSAAESVRAKFYRKGAGQRKRCGAIIA
jgi:hypothetical protein